MLWLRVASVLISIDMALEPKVRTHYPRAQVIIIYLPLVSQCIIN